MILDPVKMRKDVVLRSASWIGVPAYQIASDGDQTPVPYPGSSRSRDVDISGTEGHFEPLDPSKRFT